MRMHICRSIYELACMVRNTPLYIRGIVKWLPVDSEGWSQTPSSVQLAKTCTFGVYLIYTEFQSRHRRLGLEYPSQLNGLDDNELMYLLG